MDADGPPRAGITTSSAKKGTIMSIESVVESASPSIDVGLSWKSVDFSTASGSVVLGEGLFRFDRRQTIPRSLSAIHGINPTWTGTPGYDPSQVQPSGGTWFHSDYNGEI